MAAKEIAFPASPRPRASPEDLDAFVHGRAQEQERQQAVQPPEPALAAELKVAMKRLTFDIPADLHLRMKIACVREGKDMAEVIRQLIAARFP